jgi:hypothetical protein
VSQSRARASRSSVLVPPARAEGKCAVVCSLPLSGRRPPKLTTSVTARSLSGWSQPSHASGLLGSATPTARAACAHVHAIVIIAPSMA